MKYVTIHGHQVPAVGFGTWQLRQEDCLTGVQHALALGYRHVDTAQAYENEAEVGRAINSSGVPRDDIFLTTKIRPENFKRGNVIESTHESLRKLDTDYVDLLLLHWPNPDVPLEETLTAMLELRDAGKVRHLGVSNFPPSLVQQASRHAPIFANQVEYHPYLSQDKLLAQAQEMDYLLTAYCPLLRGQVLHDEVLREIGQGHGKTSAQVALRWLIQQDHVATIPKAASDKHRAANLDIFDFELSEAEMQQIFGLRRGKRLIDPQDLAPDWED